MSRTLFNALLSRPITGSIVQSCIMQQTGRNGNCPNGNSHTFHLDTHTHTCEKNAMKNASTLFAVPAEHLACATVTCSIGHADDGLAVLSPYKQKCCKRKVPPLLRMMKWLPGHKTDRCVVCWVQPMNGACVHFSRSTQSDLGDVFIIVTIFIRSFFLSPLLPPPSQRFRCKRNRSNAELHLECVLHFFFFSLVYIRSFACMSFVNAFCTGCGIAVSYLPCIIPSELQNHDKDKG